MGVAGGVQAACRNACLHPVAVALRGAGRGQVRARGEGRRKGKGREVADKRATPVGERERVSGLGSG